MNVSAIKHKASWSSGALFHKDCQSNLHLWALSFQPTTDSHFYNGLTNDIKSTTQNAITTVSSIVPVFVWHSLMSFVSDVNTLLSSFILVACLLPPYRWTASSSQICLLSSVCLCLLELLFRPKATTLKGVIKQRVEKPKWKRCGISVCSPKCFWGSPNNLGLILIHI